MIGIYAFFSVAVFAQEAKPEPLSDRDLVAATFEQNPYGVYAAFIEGMDRDKSLNDPAFRTLSMQFIMELRNAKGTDSQRMAAVLDSHASDSPIRHYIDEAVVVISERNFMLLTERALKAQKMMNRFRRHNESKSDDDAT